MWEAENQRIAELEDLRRRQSRERVVTRGRRQLLLELPPLQPQSHPQGTGRGAMAMAAATDDDLTHDLEGDGAESQAGRAVLGQGSQTDATDETLMGLQQDADLRGAVASAIGDNPGGGAALADTTRRTNSPVGPRLRELISRQNAWRDGANAYRSGCNFGGASPRTRPDTETT